MHMWQSRVEMEGYSVAYFDRVAVFEALPLSPALNGRSALQRFECSNAIEIHDGITFNFYTRLPHMHNKKHYHKLRV